MFQYFGGRAGGGLVYDNATRTFSLYGASGGSGSFFRYEGVAGYQAGAGFTFGYAENPGVLTSPGYVTDIDALYVSGSVITNSAPIEGFQGYNGDYQPRAGAVSFGLGFGGSQVPTSGGSREILDVSALMDLLADLGGC